MRKGYFQFLIFLCFVCVQNLQAQKYDIENFSVKEGLPSSQVYRVVQDNNGYLWFATDRGLSRYDGYQFKNLGLRDSLPDNVVLRLYQQQNNDIWGATASGELFYFNTEDYIIRPYKYNAELKKHVGKWSINSLYIDEGKSIYLGFYLASGFIMVDSSGTINNQLKTEGVKFDKGFDDGYNAYVVDAVKLGAPNSSNLTFVTFDDTSNLKNLLPGFKFQLFTSGRPYRIKYHRHLARTQHLGENTIAFGKGYIAFSSLSTSWRKYLDNGPIDMGFYKEGQIWVGTKNGVEIYDFKGELINSFLPGKAITDLLVDHNGSIWCSTLNSGVYFIRSTDIIKKELNNKIDPRQIKSVDYVPNTGVFACYNGGLVLKFNNSESIYLKAYGKNLPYDKDLKKTISLSANLSLNNSFAYNKFFNNFLHLKNRGFNLFIGDKEIYKLSSKGYGAALNILDNDDCKEFLLVGDFGFGVVDENLSYKWYKLGETVYSVRRANNDKGWYVGTNKGLFFYSQDASDTVLKKIDIPIMNNIRSISGNKNYNVLASLGNGFIVFNEDTVFNITTNEGLYDNNVEQVYKLNDSTYLCLSNSGLNRVQFSGGIDNYIVTGISEADGLSSNEIRDVTVVSDSLWVATTSGINVLPTSCLEKKEHSSLFLKIKDININNLSFTQDDLHNLSYMQNNLKVEFTAVSFNKNTQLEYRYQIQGLEDEWNYTTSRIANYPSLPPGSYKFVVQATDGDSGYREEAYIDFSIMKPYYATWWFKTILVITITALVYLFFRVRILTYNKDIIRELLRHFLKWIRRNQKYVIIKSQGKNIKLITSDIYYIKSSGNYIEIHTAEGMHLVRAKIGEFIEELPDQIEFLRVHRSYIIRLDKVEQHSSNTVTVKGEEIPIGNRYKAIYLKSVF